jgi:hypothetical protein
VQEQNGRHDTGGAVRDQDSSLAWEAFRHYDDAAGRRFDDALAALPLTPLQRRELRFWHRQAMDALRLYAARALPAALTNIDTAQQEADELVARAAAAWQRAAAAATRSSTGPGAAAPPPGPRAPADADTRKPADPATIDAGGPPASPTPGPPIDLTIAEAQDLPDALEIRRRALAARLAAGS